MPRRPVLTVIERQELLALPTDAVQRVQHFTLTDSDLAIIRQRRGEGNRLGFAAQLCYLRFPGRALGVDEIPEPALLEMLSRQLGVSVDRWEGYAKRAQTRSEHFEELQTWLGLRTFGLPDYRRWAATLALLLSALIAAAPSPKPLSKVSEARASLFRRSTSLSGFAAKR